mgnify:CR=1 FL=1
MPKLKIKVEENPVESVKVEEAPVVVAKQVKSTWPEVGTTGRFNAVKFQHGYVVYNTVGQRATGVVTKDQAEDIVRAQNRAAQIKK